jgi:hypothetical protein
MAAKSQQVKDETWREYAELTRDVLARLGFGLAPDCLPHEAHPCGGGYGAHAQASLSVLRAVADHQLEHAGGLLSEVYQWAAAQLKTDGCQLEGRL